MTESESIAYLQERTGFEGDSKGLLLLRAIRMNIETDNSLQTKDDTQKKVGLTVIAFAGVHDLSDDQLLDFFNTTREAVLEQVGEDWVREHGMYRALVTSPGLSPVCELFFDAWLAASYENDPMKCRIRRIGEDAFRIVAVLPAGGEVEYPETVTAREAMEYSSVTLEDLQVMPVLQ